MQMFDPYSILQNMLRWFPTTTDLIIFDHEKKKKKKKNIVCCCQQNEHISLSVFRNKKRQWLIKNKNGEKRLRLALYGTTNSARTRL